MGWNTYFGIGGAPTEQQVRSVTDTMVASGLRDAGYTIVWIDGNWAAPTPRSASGRLTADPARFPSGMKSLVDYIHRRGMKAGIYTDAGPYIPGQCGLGSYGHYADDVRLFAGWGFDAVKADWLCGRASGLDPETLFGELAAVVHKAGRPLIFNICNPVSPDWGGGPYPPEKLSTWSYTYAPRIADSWRTYTDVGLGTPEPRWEWQWVLRNLDVNAYHPAATSPGHFNDPDYLVPMRPLPGGGTELSLEESKTQLGMWAMMAAPLIIGSDPRTLPREMIAALRNPEIIAVDQDRLVRQGVKVAEPGPGLQIWSKTLTGTGNRAIALLNRGAVASPITVRFADVALGGRVRVRDLWARRDVASAGRSYTAVVPAHGVAMLRLGGSDQVAGADLGRPPSSPVVSHESAQFTRGADDAVWWRPSARERWISLGGRVTSVPSVAFRGPTSWTVYARGADGVLWSRSFSSGWTRVGGPVISGAPSAVVDGAGAVHVAVRIKTDEIWEWSGSSWSNLGGTLNSSPALVVSAGQVRVFAIAADRRLWQWNSADRAWSQLSEFSTDAAQEVTGAVAGPNGSAIVTVRGVDGHLHRLTLGLGAAPGLRSRPNTARTDGPGWLRRPLCCARIPRPCHCSVMSVSDDS
jgi:alpha-galactosidase